MEQSPEVHVKIGCSKRNVEKREIGRDASMRSVRRRDARDPPKEHAPGDDSSEFWAELGNLREYITCTYTVAVFQPFIVSFVAFIVSLVQYSITGIKLKQKIIFGH